MNTGKVALGILGGIAVGAIAGILFAPAKGTKTRKRIMKKGKGYADEVKSKFDQLASDFSQKYESVLEEAKELVSNVDTK